MCPDQEWYLKPFAVPGDAPTNEATRPGLAASLDINDLLRLKVMDILTLYLREVGGGSKLWHNSGLELCFVVSCEICKGVKDISMLLSIFCHSESSRWSSRQYRHQEQRDERT